MSLLKYDIWLSNAVQKRPRTANELLIRYGSSEKVFFARRTELERLPFLRPNEVDALDNKDISVSRGIIEDCRRKNIGIITISDGDYPCRLRNIFDAPVVLYVKGTLPDIDEEAAVAIVGTRRCTDYGRRAAKKLGRETAAIGGMVISGLARGIDSAAAEGALEAGGRFVGVLGCGVDVIYPPENGGLYQAVAAHGALVSEYPPMTPPEAAHFPARNRILSGLCLAVAVIEAPEKSGALITADYALEQGRDVFILPGNVDSPACMGSNRLLMEGASPFLNGRDILENYSAEFKLAKNAVWDESPAPVKDTPAVQLPPPEDENELAVYGSLGNGPLRTDEIIEATGLDAATIATAVTMLQLSGHIRQTDGGDFKRI